VKYADQFSYWLRSKTVLQAMFDRIIKIVRRHGMKLDVEKSYKVIRISKQSSPLQIMIDQKQLGNVEYFNNYLA
jgi:hypothetical protein